MDLKKEIVELYRKTATELPEDIIKALKKAEKEESSETGKEILNNILDNIIKAKQESKPICQDTGIPIFYIKYPKTCSQEELRKIINEATMIATEEIPLRPNAIDSLTNKNIGNIPIIHFEESEKLEITLMLKGGGSENVSGVYSLSSQELNAGRNLDGIRKCILDTVFKAQGKGCPPYIIGVAVAGSIEEAAHLSKKQLLKNLEGKNPNNELDIFEKKIIKETNQLGIGPLGLGGKTTALSLKITHAVRHSASFFVGISIGCWCLRRQRL